MNREFRTTQLWSSLQGRPAWLLVALMLAVGSYWLASSFVSRSSAQSPITVTPFTLASNLYDFTQGPAAVLVGQKTIARRSDGSTAEIGPFLGKAGRQSGLTERELAFADGHGMMIVDAVKAKATWPPLTGSHLKAWLDSSVQSPTGCLSPAFAAHGHQFKGTSTILGENVDVIQWQPLGGRTIVEWADPKLGCEAVQYEIHELQTDGSMKVGFAGKPAALKIGEPDGALFDEEAGYTEMRPSQIIQLALTKIGHAGNDFSEKEGQRLDRAYLGEKVQ
ncbi:MAG TPA: hypothetical protein VJN90_02300 [Candidatus Acidoferrales bacterium]|nr:hypothetical protein [Candidatus Acidoferrales bacterium]